jgi:hypothetical protein
MGMSDVKGLGGDDSDGVVYKTLLESTRAIPWKIDWATMKFAYIGPQIEPWRTRATWWPALAARSSSSCCPAPMRTLLSRWPSAASV